MGTREAKAEVAHNLKNLDRVIGPGGTGPGWCVSCRTDPHGGEIYQSDSWLIARFMWLGCILEGASATWLGWCDPVVEFVPVPAPESSDAG
jgi:hypothetical protein